MIFYGLANFGPDETMKTPESYEKQKVKNFLNSVGAYHFWPVQTGYGASTVDCLACINGRFVAIEVKKEGYRPSDFTKRQEITLHHLRAAGAETCTGDGEEIVEQLKNLVFRTMSPNET